MGDTFAAGVEYTATIELTPGQGYSFDGVTEDYFRVDGVAEVANKANFWQPDRRL